MVYAQFYQRAVWPEGTTEIIEGTGDRSVVVIDGRLNPQTIGRIAAAECLKRGYVAWQVFRGDSFMQAHPLSQIWYAHPDGDTVRDPAWLTAHN